ALVAAAVVARRAVAVRVAAAGLPDDAQQRLLGTVARDLGEVGHGGVPPSGRGRSVDADAHRSVSSIELEELDRAAFLELDVRLLPVRPPRHRAAVAPELPVHAGRVDRDDLHVEELLDGLA